MKIPNLEGEWRQIDNKYDYDADKCKCPNCGGIGIPWSGWFNCEDCTCLAVVKDGRAFIRSDK